MLSATAFLILALISLVRFRSSRKQRLLSKSGEANERFAELYPPVTLLKPLCGWEPFLESNLESFFQQSYPSFEIVFGARYTNDPALEVVRQVSARYPHVPVKIVLSGDPDCPNAKVSSMKKMLSASSFEYLVISDSDVRVQPEYIKEVVRPLLDPKVGLVTCIYRGVPAGGICSRLEALGHSVEMTAGVLVANMLEGMTFALGPTMALRRQVLEEIGGFEALSDYCSDDFVLGNMVHHSGHTVVLSDLVIDHVGHHATVKASLLQQLRWMRSTRFSRQWGHLGTVLTFAVPFGLLALLGGWLANRPLLGLALLAWALLNRIILSAAVGWGAVRDWRSLRDCWLYPLRDLMGFVFWCASYCSAQIVWRDRRYQLQPGGKMVLVEERRADGRKQDSADAAGVEG